MTSFVCNKFKPICDLRTSKGTTITLSFEDNALPALNVEAIEQQLRQALRRQLGEVGR